MNVAVLLSGGVDSSVALALLSRQKGLALKAYYLKIWLEEELSFLGDCPWEDDLAYARATCERLGVPLKIVPLPKRVPGADRRARSRRIAPGTHA